MQHFIFSFPQFFKEFCIFVEDVFAKFSPKDIKMFKVSILPAIACIAMTTVIFVKVDTAAVAAVSYIQTMYLYLGQDFNDKYICLTRTSASNLTANDFNDKTHSIKYNGM